MNNLELKFAQILYKYAEKLTIRTGVLASAVEEEWIWLGNDEQIAKECADLCIKELEKAFEAGRKTHCATDTSLYYETFEEFIEEENE